MITRLTYRSLLRSVATANIKPKPSPSKLDDLSLNQEAHDKALKYFNSVGFTIVPTKFPYSFCVQRKQIISTLTLFAHPQNAIYLTSKSFIKDSLPEKYMAYLYGIVHKEGTKSGMMVQLTTTHKSISIEKLHLSANIEEDKLKLFDKGIIPRIEVASVFARFKPTLQRCCMNYFNLLGINQNVILNFHDILYYNYITSCKDWLTDIKDVLV